MPVAISTKAKQNGPRKRLVTVPNAEPSVTGSAFKPERADPFKSSWHRIIFNRPDASAEFFIVNEESPNRWVAHCAGEDPLYNPWTGEPFTNKKNCIKAVKFKLVRGHWPNKRKRLFIQ